ncbi:putative acyl-[acyl-carrier-protein]--UDP-N-acetylglucosamine O-acyltransferase [Plasmopara halstedii]
MLRGLCRSRLKRLFTAPLFSTRALTTASVEELIAHATQQHYAGCREKSSRHSQDYQVPNSSNCFGEVHATAVVHPNAKLGPNVLVGPYCVVGPDVVLEADVQLYSHVVIKGNTRVGSGTVIHSFACLGDKPQDKKHLMFAKLECNDMTLDIGNNCVIREHVTIHGSTSYSQAPTRIGDDCWLLCGAHIAHDSQLGKRVVISNNVGIAGHVSIGNGAIIGGQVGIKQHVSIGPLAMVGGQSAVDADVLPYGLVVGNRAKLAGLNLVGLRRAGVPRNSIKLLLRVYRYMFDPPNYRKTGFAPALDLDFKDTVVERAMEAKRFLISEEFDEQQMPLAHEMVDFVVTSPQRSQSSICPAVIATISGLS